MRSQVVTFVAGIAVGAAVLAAFTSQSPDETLRATLRAEAIRECMRNGIDVLQLGHVDKPHFYLCTTQIDLEPTRFGPPTKWTNCPWSYYLTEKRCW